MARIVAACHYEHIVTPRRRIEFLEFNPLISIQNDEFDNGISVAIEAGFDVQVQVDPAANIAGDVTIRRIKRGLTKHAADSWDSPSIQAVFSPEVLSAKVVEQTPAQLPLM